MSGRGGSNNDEANLDVVERFDTYEDYLDSQLTATDLGYLGDEEMGRQLVELGYKIDLSDFSIVKDPSEITLVTNIMRNFPADSKTYIVTARRGNSIGPIHDYLDEIGIVEQIPLFEGRQMVMVIAPKK